MLLSRCLVLLKPNPATKGEPTTRLAEWPGEDELHVNHVRKEEMALVIMCDGLSLVMHAVKAPVDLLSYSAKIAMKNSCNDACARDAGSVSPCSKRDKYW